MAKKKEPNQETKAEEMVIVDPNIITREEFNRLVEKVRVATAYAKGAYHHIYGPGTKPKDL